MLLTLPLKFVDILVQTEVVDWPIMQHRAAENHLTWTLKFNYNLFSVYGREVTTTNGHLLSHVQISVLK